MSGTPRPAPRGSLPLTARAAGAAFLLLAACGGKGDDGAITAAGHVEATEVRLSAKIGGRLSAFDPKEGDRVAPGQLVAQVDPTDVELALATARADQAAAEAELCLKRAGARPEDIAEASAQVANVRAELKGAQRDLDRFQALLDSGSGTTKARDDALTRRDALQERLHAAEQALARLRAGFRREEIDAAAARAAAAAARVGQLAQQRRDTAIVSPVGGIITEKVAEAGELVAPGALVAVVTNLGDAWLTVYVAGPDLSRVRIGGQAEVVTDGGERRTGRVTFVASQAEFTPKNVQTREERVKLVYKVKIGLPNDDGLFKPGMPAEALFAAPAPATASAPAGSYPGRR